jgi:SOS-response transcriptional repressor LexA
MTTELAKRIAELLSAKNGGNQSELARYAGVSPQAVQQWLAGETSPRGKNLAKVAGFFEISVKDLTYGDSKDDSNVSSAPDTRGRVPIISWVQAGNWIEAVDSFPPGHAEDYVEITCPKKAHTFALRVKGDSMVNPNGAPSFPEGFILVIEPEMDVSPGDFVVAKNGDEATFKQLIKDGGDWYLKPLNPRYPLKPLGEAKVIGVVRQAILRFK